MDTSLVSLLIIVGVFFLLIGLPIIRSLSFHAEPPYEGMKGISRKQETHQNKKKKSNGQEGGQRPSLLLLVFIKLCISLVVHRYFPHRLDQWQAKKFFYACVRGTYKIPIPSPVSLPLPQSISPVVSQEEAVEEYTEEEEEEEEWEPVSASLIIGSVQDGEPPLPPLPSSVPPSPPLPIQPLAGRSFKLIDMLDQDEEGRAFWVTFQGLVSQIHQLAQANQGKLVRDKCVMNVRQDRQEVLLTKVTQVEWNELIGPRSMTPTGEQPGLLRQAQMVSPEGYWQYETLDEALMQAYRFIRPYLARRKNIAFTDTPLPTHKIEIEPVL